jgi:dTDP-4-dehydrorhamnose 3,5-epimerase
MIFTETRIKGAYIVDLKRMEDQRGFFARALAEVEFAAQGLRSVFVQGNLGFSHRKGTLRGMHFQAAPHAEAKLVRCTMGAVYDVMIDLRPASATFKQWVGVELSADNRRMLYVPEDFAHGYLTLTDNAELFYHTSQFYAPQAASGVRHDDSTFGIEWPTSVAVISEQDRRWPDYVPLGTL